MTAKKILSILIFILAISLATTCLATETPTLLGDKNISERVDKGDLTLDDFTRTAVNLSQIILGVVGSLALLAFIAGGLMFLLSGGNTERVAQGKQIILGAVIGLVIVFASYAIIQFVFTALHITGANDGGWSTISWF